MLAKEYQYLSALGYEVFIITYRFESPALFGVAIPKASLIELGKTGLSAIAALAKAIRDLGNPLVLCSSGRLDIYLASIIGNFQYALHIHHPCFMSFNDYDKYSLQMRRHFKKYTQSNFGADRFIAIQNSLTLWRRMKINLRALLSRAAQRRSRCNFVLSRYAQREKHDLYGIHAEVLCGALDDDFTLTRQKERTTVQGDGAFTLLSVARLDINKRLDELIRSLPILIADGYSVRLLVVGDGPEKIALGELVEELDLGRRVELLGFVPDDELPSIYAQADLFVSIDWADYKITLFESLSHGLPVLVSDETECDDRLMELGYVMDVQPTAKELATVLIYYMSNPATIDQQAITPILMEYTWGRYFQRIAESLASTGLILPPTKTCNFQTRQAGA